MNGEIAKMVLGLVAAVLILTETLKYMITRFVPKTESTHEKKLIRLLETIDTKVSVACDGNTKLLEMHDVKDDQGRYIWYGYGAMTGVTKLLTEIKDSLYSIAKAVDISRELADSQKIQASAVSRIADEYHRPKGVSD